MNSKIVVVVFVPSLMKARRTTKEQGVCFCSLHSWKRRENEKKNRNLRREKNKEIQERKDCRVRENRPIDESKD